MRLKKIIQKIAVLGIGVIVSLGSLAPVEAQGLPVARVGRHTLSKARRASSMGR